GTRREVPVAPLFKPGASSGSPPARGRRIRLGDDRERARHLLGRAQRFFEPRLEKGRGAQAWLSRRLWRIATLDPVSRRIGARTHGHCAVIARLSRRRPWTHGARQPPRLDARRLPLTAKGGARRC